jgi:hypothetical protein
MAAYAFKQQDLERVKRECKARARKLRTANFGTPPRFTPGMTTANYIRLFSIGRGVLPIDMAKLERSAPYLLPREDEVVVETVDDLEDIL